MSKTLSLFVASIMLSACAGGRGIPDTSQQVKPGDEIKLNQELTVSAGKASVIIQNGQIQGGSSVDRFTASCRFVMREITTSSQKLVPDKFIVSQVSYWEDIRSFGYRGMFSGPEFINYETTMRLQSQKQPAVHSLVCKHDDEEIDGRHVLLSEMQKALGGIARIIKKSP
jgi:hypothetical protein